MSTRRPNVPRANRSARSTGPAGGGGEESADGAVEAPADGPGKTVTANDDVISAEVLHPDFASNGRTTGGRKSNDDVRDDRNPDQEGSKGRGSKGQSSKGQGSNSEGPNGQRTTVAGAGVKTETAAGKSADKKAQSRSKATGSKASSTATGPKASGSTTGSKASGTTSGTASGSAPRRKSRLSASARRASERDSAKYAVRQPVVSWTRPGDAAHGSGAASGAAGEPVPAKSFSGRLLALAVVLIAMIVILAPTVQTYVEQRMEINALQQDIAAQQSEQQRLQTQLSRWEDPAYIKQQARERLFLVMPGETRYLVVGADKAKEPEQIPASPTGDEDVPWVDALFESIKRSATD
ncbi:FtsB family cell division protein [Arthrobacter pigmenti]